MLGAVGFVVMAVASAWAPLQPELIDTGAACQMAQCGTLEDPERWRRSWWLWSVGALATAVAAAFVLTPRQPYSSGVVLLVMSAVLVVVPLAMLAFLLSVLTSVQGVATVAVLVPLIVLALLGAWVRGRPPAAVPKRDRGSARPRA